MQLDACFVDGTVTWHNVPLTWQCFSHMLMTLKNFTYIWVVIMKRTSYQSIPVGRWMSSTYYTSWVTSLFSWASWLQDRIGPSSHCWWEINITILWPRPHTHTQSSFIRSVPSKFMLQESCREDSVYITEDWLLHFIKNKLPLSIVFVFTPNFPEHKVKHDHLPREVSILYACVAKGCVLPSTHLWHKFRPPLWLTGRVRLLFLFPPLPSFPILILPSRMACSPRHHEVTRGNTETRLLCVYAVMMCAHHLSMREKNCPLGWFLLHLPYTHKHTKTLLQMLTYKYSQGRCRGLSRDSNQLIEAQTKPFILKLHTYSWHGVWLRVRTCACCV